MYQLDERKRQWFVKTFGEETTAKFDKRLGDLAGLADELNIPKKEMSVMTDENVVIDEGEELATDPEQNDVQEKDTSPPDTGGDGQAITQTQLTAVINEVVKGVSAAFTAQNEAMAARVGELEQKIASLTDSMNKEVISNTPALSLSAVIAQSIVGNESAQVDYNKERTLHQSAPEMDTAGPAPAGQTHIPFLNDMISKQRGGRTAWPVGVNGAQ